MKFLSRKMVMDADLNPAGTLFGGKALAWIDEEAAIFALCQLKYPQGSHLVTKLMSTINFMNPARKGDIIEIGMSTVACGKTSITVECVLRNKFTKKEIVAIDKVVFVNVNEAGTPTPHLITMETLGQS